MNSIDGNLALKEEPGAAPRREFRRERVDGKLVMMAPPSANHHFIAQNLYRIFAGFLAEKPCRAIMDGMMVFLSEKDHFIPDMMVVCDRSKITKDGVYGAPDLVVEVLSLSTRSRDRGYKRDLYERSGVREYWIVNPWDQSVEQYLLEQGRFRCVNIYSFYQKWEMEMLSPEEREEIKTVFPCGIFPDLEISLDDVFYDLIES